MSTEDLFIVGMLDKQSVIMDANQRAASVADLATITLLIDHGLVTIEQAAQRIEQIHRSLPDGYQAPLVGERIRILTEWLRAHDVPHRRGRTPLVIQGGLGHPDQAQTNDPSDQPKLPPSS